MPGRVLEGESALIRQCGAAGPDELREGEGAAPGRLNEMEGESAFPGFKFALDRPWKFQSGNAGVSC